VGYLVIFLAVAGTGIGSLWLYQRRARRHMDSVDGFRSSLERISMHEIKIPDAPVRPERSVAPARPSGSRRPEPLDPARREAARRRLERRRAARA
jgi:hypothetical protein